MKLHHYFDEFNCGIIKDFFISQSPIYLKTTSHVYPNKYTHIIIKKKKKTPYV